MSWIKELGEWTWTDWLFATVIIVLLLGAIGGLIGRDLLGGIPLVGELLSGLRGMLSGLEDAG